MASPYVCLVGRAGSELRKGSVLVPPLRTFVVVHKPRLESQILLDLGCGFGRLE